jgi:hypothetical protein
MRPYDGGENSVVSQVFFDDYLKKDSSHVREQAAPLARQGSSALAMLSLHRT